MKIRIKGNSIRIRITQSELDRLVEKGEVISHCQLNGELKLTYGIQAKEGNDELELNSSDNSILIDMPLSYAEEWRETDRVGWSQSVQSGKESKTDLLIEKDFKCLIDRPDEDESDNFPNPMKKRP